MSDASRICPVPTCHERLGTTRTGDPWLLCRRHWQRVDAGLLNRLWRAYRAWQRIERQFRKAEAEGRSTTPFVLPRASAIQAYLDIRGDAIRQASRGEPAQLEASL